MKALRRRSERDWAGVLITPAYRVTRFQISDEKLDIHILCATRELLWISQHTHTEELSCARVDDYSNGSERADVNVRNHAKHREIVRDAAIVGG